jgi:hypothetical protein
MTTTTAPTTALRTRRAAAAAARLAETLAMAHPLDHMVPGGCYDCHSFSGPIVGCDCDGCTDMRGHHPERTLKDGRLVAVDGSRQQAIPTSAEVAAHAADMAALERPQGDGTGHGTRTADGPTEKQIAFIARLAAEKQVECPTPATKRAASAEIDRLMALPTPAAPAAAVEAIVGKFAQIDGVWMVRLPMTAKVNEGDTVQVRKGNGDMKDVVLGVQDQVFPETGTALWNIVDDRRPAAAAPATECPEGIHRTPDGTIYKVYRTQTSGNLAAKRLRIIEDRPATETEPAVYHGEFDYESGAIRRHQLGEATRLSHAEAARFGALYSFCCACGHTLDDERSLDAGYGPRCASRNGWPWGKKQRVSAPQPEA